MSYLEIAKKVFDIESKAILDLGALLDDNFTNSVDSIFFFIMLNFKGNYQI